MAVLQDFECPACGRKEYDVYCTGGIHFKNCLCGARMDILWQRHSQDWIGIHPRERAVVWYNPQTGRHSTPGRNDVPMPERYRKAGYERREFETLRDLDKYCKANKLVNEKANYNSGRSYDED